MSIRKWRKRKKGTPAQVGKPFPIYSPASVNGPRKTFKSELQHARPAKRSMIKTTNPLSEPKPEQSTPLQSPTSISATPITNFMREDKDEIKEELIQKILQYWREHPELSPEQATREAMDDSTYSRENIKTSTQKIKNEIGKILTKLGIAEKEENEPEENAFVYVDKDAEA